MTQRRERDWRGRLMGMITLGMRDREGRRLVIPWIVATIERIDADPELSRWLSGLSNEELREQFLALYEREVDDWFP